jgi:hypothetical protein
MVLGIIFVVTSPADAIASHLRTSSCSIPATSEYGMIIKDTESVDIHTFIGPMRTYLFRPATEGRYPGLLLFSEIFQMTGRIERP